MHTYSQEFVTRANGNVLAGTRLFGMRMPVRYPVGRSATLSQHLRLDSSKVEQQPCKLWVAGSNPVPNA